MHILKKENPVKKLCALLLISVFQLYAADPYHYVSIVPLKYLSDQVASECSQIWFDTLGNQKHDNYNEIKEDHIAFLKKHKNDTKPPIMFVALLKTKPIGMCAIRKTAYPRKGAVLWADEHEEDVAPWLAGFCVAKEHQSKEVATKLATFALTHARDTLQLETLYFLSEDAQMTKLYEKQKGCEQIQEVICDGKPAQVFKVDILKALESD